jgi:hypothetical protein
MAGFDKKANVNSVMIAVQGRDELIIMEGEYLETDDPLLISELDANDAVKRATSPSNEMSADDESAEVEESEDDDNDEDN